MGQEGKEDEPSYESYERPPLGDIWAENQKKKKEEPREELLKYRDQSVCYEDSESKRKRQKKAYHIQGTELKSV